MSMGVPRAASLERAPFVNSVVGKLHHALRNATTSREALQVRLTYPLRLRCDVRTIVSAFGFEIGQDDG
jgi:hypothetical protein